MRATGLALAMLFLAAASCDNRDRLPNGELDCHGNYYVATGFSAIDRAEIQAGADRWNAFLQRPAITLTDGYSPDGTCVIRPGDAGGDAVGRQYGNTGAITIDTSIMSSRYSNGNVDAVTVHEIGHGLGLGHVSDGVMSHANGGKWFAKDDATECMRVGVCTIEQMNRMSECIHDHVCRDKFCGARPCFE
jgi:hypothetical protein